MNECCMLCQRETKREAKIKSKSKIIFFFVFSPCKFKQSMPIMGRPRATASMILVTVLCMNLFLESIMSERDSGRSSTSSTIYEHLRLQGLPVGLLPKGISRYSINSTSGEFEVLLEEPCNAKFENEVHYDSNISGTLAYGRIAQLLGVSAQELFLWFPVKGIRVDVPSSGLIHFDVGVVDKQFSLSLFETPPDCTAAQSPPIQVQVHSDSDTDQVLKAVS